LQANHRRRRVVWITTEFIGSRHKAGNDEEFLNYNEVIESPT